MSDDSHDALELYRAKRSAGSTPEPFGQPRRSGLARGGLFVVQKHAARRTHFDLRLEVDGVLKSWAVPKGPSADPEDKRLAVQTEDHPFEYGDFEGVIPEGNYGAGAMIVWDRGIWLPHEDPVEGLEKGKLLFELHGYKLRGLWTLFRTRPPAIHRGKSPDEDRQWLLMKKPDEHADPERSWPEGSVLSGLTVEELGEGAPRIERLLDEVHAEAPEGRLRLAELSPMLAKTGETPFSREGWLFELKYDGYRLLAEVRDGEARLRYRNGHDASALYPEITRSLARLPVPSAILDGEVVVTGEEGRPSFQRLQKRALLSRPLDVERAALVHPASVFVFDLLALDDHDLRALPLLRRKELLRGLLPEAGSLRFCDHVETRGRELFERIEAMGLEGMMAKDADSTYVERRSARWLKFPIDRTDDFVIVGFTEPEGNRTGFGALHLATPGPDGDGLLYAGRVGTGFDEALLEELSTELLSRIRSDPPCRGELPRGKSHRWVEPELVCEVRFKEHTEQGLLRHPVFLRLRDDKSVEQMLTDASGRAGVAEEPPVPAVQPEETPRLRFSNLDKVFWPASGETKGDLIEYYRSVAGSILPWLEDRPVVLTRYPDGVEGKSFFQKNAPDFAPEWIRTETIRSDGSERPIDYFVCNDEETLLYLANLGAIVLHVWASRLGSLDRPDWCVLDLDPKEAPFEHVVELARRCHELAEEIGLPSYVKTSGASGLHVLLPLGRQLDHEQSRTLGQLVAELLARRHPEIATTTRSLDRREGRVYVDWVQNGRGRLLVAPYSVRALPGAPVSAPLRWREVTGKLEPGRFDLHSMPRRIARQRDDPLDGLLDDAPDLLAALDRLGRLV